MRLTYFQALRPIPDADVIEVATVLGWNVVVKKNLYKEGDLVIYVEIDSILPPWEYFINGMCLSCTCLLSVVRVHCVYM
jgi:hypothetical protein